MEHSLEGILAPGGEVPLPTIKLLKSILAGESWETGFLHQSKSAELKYQQLLFSHYSSQLWILEARHAA